MELGCLPQLGLVLARQAHPLPEGFGEAGHGGVALGELWVAFLEGAEQYVAALTVRGAPLAGFLGVHALVDQAHGLGDVLAFLGEQDGSVGGGDGEPAAVLAECLGSCSHDRGGGIGLHGGQDVPVVGVVGLALEALVGQGRFPTELDPLRVPAPVTGWYRWSGGGRRWGRRTGSRIHLATGPSGLLARRGPCGRSRGRFGR